MLWVLGFPFLVPKLFRSGWGECRPLFNFRNLLFHWCCRGFLGASRIACTFMRLGFHPSTLCVHGQMRKGSHGTLRRFFSWIHFRTYNESLGLDDIVDVNWNDVLSLHNNNSFVDGRIIFFIILFSTWRNHRVLIPTRRWEHFVYRSNAGACSFYDVIFLYFTFLLRRWHSIIFVTRSWAFGSWNIHDTIQISRFRLPQLSFIASLWANVVKPDSLIVQSKILKASICSEINRLIH